jgi:dihydrodipicolinate synthase/N-acetylneuraminate lyase
MQEATRLIEVMTIASVEFGPSIIKNAMKLNGRKINATVRSPLPQLNAEQLEKLKSIMKNSVFLIQVNQQIG